MIESRGDEKYKVTKIKNCLGELEYKVHEVASKYAVGEMRVDDEVKKLDSKIYDAVSRVAAVDIWVTELDEEWLTAADSVKWG
jgi:hypothetical protein